MTPPNNQEKGIIAVDIVISISNDASDCNMTSIDAKVEIKEDAPCMSVECPPE